MSEDLPRSLNVETPAGVVAALAWGDPAAPLAMLLHGFPDSAHTWRLLGPVLAEQGWHVVAPWLRGYAPTFAPADDRYDAAALSADALAVAEALDDSSAGDPQRERVLVGHDWGAIIANGLAAQPTRPFARVVSLAVPPLPAMTAPRPLLVAGQLRRSWYMAYAQTSRAERALETLVPRLWRDWSPGYDADEDVRLAMEAIHGREAAVLGYYRALARPWARRGAGEDWPRLWLRSPVVPTLHLHGENDGCLGVGYAEAARRRLGDDRVVVVPDSGHFLHLEKPAQVHDLVTAFLGSPRP